MKRKANFSSWLFIILIIYTMIFGFSILFGKTIIRNSEDLQSIYGTTPTAADSLNLMVRIATFGVVNIVPLWVTLLVDLMGLIIILGIVFTLRGVS